MQKIAFLLASLLVGWLSQAQEGQAEKFQGSSVTHIERATLKKTVEMKETKDSFQFFPRGRENYRRRIAKIK